MGDAKETMVMKSPLRVQLEQIEKDFTWALDVTEDRRHAHALYEGGRKRLAELRRLLETPNALEDAVIAFSLREALMLTAWRKIPPMMQNLYYACFRTHTVKGADYTIGSEDRLANFKEAGRLSGITPRQAWSVYAYKHWSAICTFVKQGAVSSEPVWKRIMDVMVYLTLLWLMAIEEGQTQNAFPPEIQDYKPEKDS